MVEKIDYDVQQSLREQVHGAAIVRFHERDRLRQSGRRQLSQGQRAEEGDGGLSERAGAAAVGVGQPGLDLGGVAADGVVDAGQSPILIAGDGDQVGKADLVSFMTPPGAMLVAPETLSDLNLAEGTRPKASISTGSSQ